MKSTWKYWADHGLMRIGIPGTYAGTGGGWRDLCAAGAGLVADAGLGMAMAWMVHMLAARCLILNWGSLKQHQRYLPALASGEMTACFAVSEPDAGAHPKLLTTAGENQGDYYVLNGEKTWITNSPIADLFIVVAVTGITGTQKRFSAFLIEKGAPGLTLTDPIVTDVLKPSVHGGLVLKNCRIPASRILGRPGRAFEDMVKPFKAYEDMMITAMISGAMTRIVELSVEKPAIDAPTLETGNAGEAFAETIGRLRSFAAATRTLGLEAAALADDNADMVESMSLLPAARHLMEAFIGDARDLPVCRQSNASQPNPGMQRATLIHDMVFLQRLGARISRIRAIQSGKKHLKMGNQTPFS